MNERLRQAADWLDALTLRERAAIAAAVLLVLWGGWTVLSFDAIEGRRADAEQRLAAARSKLNQLGERAERVEASRRVDPDALNIEERDRLQIQVRALDAELEARAGQMITPEQMVGTLRELLAEQGGLTLERFELLAPVSAIASDDDETEQAGRRNAPEADLYRHAIEIEWVGGYLETLRYLRAVERLGWTLYWERLDYTVTEHPEARVRLRLFTLSEQEDWIGV